MRFGGNVRLPAQNKASEIHLGNPADPGASNHYGYYFIRIKTGSSSDDPVFHHILVIVKREESSIIATNIHTDALDSSPFQVNVLILFWQ